MLVSTTKHRDAMLINLRSGKTPNQKTYPMNCPKKLKNT